MARVTRFMREECRGLSGSATEIEGALDENVENPVVSALSENIFSRIESALGKFVAAIWNRRLC